MAETTISVEGKPYALPALDTLTIREGKTLKRQSGMTIDQFFELEGLDAGAIGGLLAVAIMRADPTLSEREIDSMVDDVNLFAIMEELALLAEEPNPTMSLVGDGSKPSSSEPTASSGGNGSDASAPSPEPSSQASTGAPDSGTLQDSDPTTSEASLPIS